MDSNPHKIFVTMEDRWNWDKYIEQCDLIELNDEDRQRAKESFHYLRNVLGESYLKRADKHGNPMFFWYFANSASVARLSLIRFTDALKALEGTPNYKAVLKRIRKPKDLDDLVEGMSVIDTAHKCFKAGFDIEFEPDVRVPNHRGVLGPKKPDMKVINRKTGEEIIVEVSRMMSGADQNLITRTFHIIWNALIEEGMHNDPESFKDILLSRHILPYALIHRGIEDRDLKVIVDKIAALITHVRTSGEFGELIIQDTIEVGIASYDDHETARKWAASRGLTATERVRGASFPADEIARAKVKLRVKLKQLPEDRPGVIVLSASDNLIFLAYDIKWIVAAMAEEVEKHPKLLSVIMFHVFTDGSDESSYVDMSPHKFARQVRSDGTVEESLVIYNTKCNQSVSAETLQMVHRSFAF